METREPTTVLVIGGRGFVGSAICRAARRAGWDVTAVGHPDYGAVAGRAFDLVVNANGNARRYLADRDPAADFDASVRTVVRSLADFPCRHYALISTVDVYVDPSREDATDEDAAIDPVRLGAYGFHKRLAELCVMRQAPSWQVFRLGQMVGPGLRKGPVYDLLHGQPLRIAPDSEMPFLRTDEMARIVCELINRAPAGQVFNVCGAGSVPFTEVIARLGKAGAPIDPAAPRQAYRIRIDKARALCDVPSSLDEMRRFAETAPGRG